MKRLTLKILAGVAALAAASSVFADTALNSGTTGNGSIIVAVIDLTANTSFTYDTGKTVGSWDGTFSTVDLSSDPNWTSFASSILSGDTVVYQIQGVNTVAPTNYVLDMSSNAAAGTTFGKLGSITNADLIHITAMNSYYNAVNAIHQTSTNSIFASTSVNPTAYAGDQLSLGTLNVNPRAALGTAISFYQWVLGSTPDNNLQKAVVAGLGGMWTLTTTGLLSFAGSAAVPLPPSVTLLLSGAVLLLLISRRRSTGGLLSIGTPA